MRRSRRLAVGLLAASLGSAAADTPAPTVSPARPFAVEGVFQTADRPPARDLSGIACKPAPEGAAQRLCLVVNDRDRFAQIATLTNGGITPGPTVVLLGARPSETVVGVAPQGMACSAGEAGFSDLDGEAVAYAEPYFYILGSHGCSRSREYRPSRFILARVRIDDQGRVVGKVGHEAASPVDALRLTETTYRLSEALRMVEPVGAQFGRDLEPNGLNLEGLAIVGGVLYAGLRAPSLDGYAYIVSTDVEPLFTPDTPLEPRVIPLALGRDAGIRDLAPLPDGRILVLAGPAQDDQLEVHFALFALDLREGRFTRLATLDDPQGICTPGPRAISGKPEAVLPLGLDEDWLRVLILSDSLPNGAPCEYRVPRQ